ncbi:MAG: EamA family transporter [Candidatus Moduliflexus flocculans]|nr:EamA family transporter [Candidatus Moduliflexus flocculans]
MVLLGGIFSGILLLFTGLPTRSLWTYIAISVLLEAVYFILLSNAYTDHDFSLVYPVARGTAPAFLMVWSVLFLREELTPGGILGILLIVGGMIVIGTTSLVRTQGRRVRLYRHFHRPDRCPRHLTLHLRGRERRPERFAPALRPDHVRARPGPDHNLQPAPLWLEALPLRLGRAAPAADHSPRSSAWSPICLRFSRTPSRAVSCSGAIREMSVVIGAFLGWQFLGETMGGMRVLGSIVIFAGILTIAIFG